MSKTIKELEMEILEYEEMIDELTPQLCGDENDEEFEEEIRKCEEIISRNKNEIMNETIKQLQKEIRETKERMLNYQNQLDEEESVLYSIEYQDRTPRDYSGVNELKEFILIYQNKKDELQSELDSIKHQLKF